GPFGLHRRPISPASNLEGSHGRWSPLYGQPLGSELHTDTHSSIFYEWKKPVSIVVAIHPRTFTLGYSTLGCVVSVLIIPIRTSSGCMTSGCMTSDRLTLTGLRPALHRASDIHMCKVLFLID
ncbi:uncharacterized protein LOC119570781, partial [Penaeus monodon]